MSFFFVFLCIALCALQNEKEQVKKESYREKRGLIICRVSTAEQKKGTSLDTQEIWGLKREFELEVKNACDPIKKDISGELFPKEFFDYIMDLVKKEKITHVFVYSFDRLSRSFSYGVWLVQSFWDNDVQIVTSTFMPDKNKHFDRIKVWFELLIAEVQHGDIEEKTKRGIIHKLRQGLWMREDPPWGFELVDGKLHVIEGFIEIIQFIFDTYILTENYAETARKTNDKYGGKYDKPLTSNNIRSIVNDIKYTGYYGFDGAIIGDIKTNNQPHKGMNAIDKITWDKAQSIIIKRRREKTKTSHKIPIIEEWKNFYGQEYVYEEIDHTPRCPHCYSADITKEGSQVRNGTLIRLYRCIKENFVFRSPSAAQIKKFNSFYPLRCMYCGSVDSFNVRNSQLTDYLEVVCKECGFLALVKKKDDLFPYDKDIRKEENRKTGKNKSEKKK
jgi:DNA invertase Pin-like site-specific DNA recombinase/DNA-directed RNA polymerase subunit RPC12/RpoP